MTTPLKKSEILYLYDTSYNIPNGDPFTGEQRYDEETRRILVSDVRIKRYIRSYLEETKNKPVYVSENTGAGKADSKSIIKWLYENRNPGNLTDIGELLREQIDVRLFGGIATLKDEDIKMLKCTNGRVQFTGPVQFAMLNPSLNEINLRLHQNTTYFLSKETNSQGAIGTTSIVPYSVIQVHGWVNPKVAQQTGMTLDDHDLMLEALWYGASGIGRSHSRSKVGQNSLLLLEIIYAGEDQKIYNVNRLITIKPFGDIKMEQIRSTEDYFFDLSKLIDAVSTDKVEKVIYLTEVEEIEHLFSKNGKFEKMRL